MEKLLSAYIYAHSITSRKIINKVLTILFLDAIPCILLPERCITLQASGNSKFSYVCNCFYNCREKPQDVSVKRLFEILWKVTSFKGIFSFNQICGIQIRKTRLGGCFWKVLSYFNYSKFFRFLYSSCNKIFI